MMKADFPRRSAPLSEVAADDADLGERQTESRPEGIFVLIAGALYGIVVGLCLRGEFATSLVCVVGMAACIWLGWWIRGVRS